MSIWRKASATDNGAHNINGWIKIRSIWRKASVEDTINSASSSNPWVIDGWLRIKSVWQLGTSGLWFKIFGTGLPNAETANPPELTFVSPAGFESIDNPFNGDKMYLVRGQWNEDPTKFTMYIQKSSPPYSTWTDLITPVVKEYDDYSDADYLYQVPVSAVNRPLITKTNVYDKVKFRGKIKAENSSGESDLNFPGLGVAARYFFNILSFEITDETQTSVTLSWTYDPATITVSQIPTYMWSQIISLYDSAGVQKLYVPEPVPLTDTSVTISLPNTLDPNDSYQWELSIIADDYYREFTGTRYDSDGPTQELAFIDWQPGVIEDPTITFSNRTRTSFSVDWLSTNATQYRVDIKRNSTGASLPGYPVTTTDTSAVLSGLTENALYNVSVTALGGTAIPPKESDTVTESIRTLNFGIEALLSKAFDATATSFKITILNYADISSFSISLSCTNGNATRSGSTIFVTNVSQDQTSCVSVTTSKIDDVDLTAFSYDYETSVEVCETPGTWYCVTYVQGTPVTCSTFTSTTNVSGNGSGYATACYVTPSCCVKTEYGEYSAYTTCTNGLRSRTRTKTEYFLNCTSTVTTETVSDPCWLCTQSVQSNCAGCTQTTESSNISGSGSGYSISCSQTAFPACQTPCICNTAADSACGAWGAWTSCSGGYRSRTRTCPAGSPCETSQTQQCWYCTTSVNVNCAGCSTSIEGSNISGSGSGYSISCSTSGYPACQTPCTCDATQSNACGAWGAYGTCSGGSQTRTRTCPAGSSCVTSESRTCETTWYCTTSVSGQCGCSNNTSTTNTSGSGSGYSITCNQTAYPACPNPCASIDTISTIDTINTIATIATIATIDTIDTINTINTIDTINTIATIDTGGGGCFVFGTKVQMSDGSWKNIEDLFVGDQIMAADVPGVPDDELAYDYMSGWQQDDISQTSKVTAYVTNVKNRLFNEYYKINDIINVTYEHIVPVQKNGIWKFSQIEDIQIGDNIMNDALEVIPVLSKELIVDNVETTSIDIDVKDIYFVKGMMAHNLNPDKQIPD